MEVGIKFGIVPIESVRGDDAGIDPKFINTSREPIEHRKYSKYSRDSIRQEIQNQTGVTM